MPGRYDEVRRELMREPRRWLVTGAAGFIGSHLAEELLRLGQTVVGLDDFSTGTRLNVGDLLAAVPDSRGRFRLRAGDVRNPRDCRDACAGVDYVLHHAAVASVPRGLAEPGVLADVNVRGTVNVLHAARLAGVRRVVCASSSAVYGDLRAPAQREDEVGTPLSPYALGKREGELWGDLFGRVYGLPVVSLRYFNVIGPRQDPAGPYAAVVPAWTRALLAGEPCVIHGDGAATRDFIGVRAVVRANLLAALAPLGEGPHVFNVGSGHETSLTDLYALLRDAVAAVRPEAAWAAPVHDAPRPGEVRHSRADLSRGNAVLGYVPEPGLDVALAETVRWHAARLPAPRVPSRAAA
ncbi:MAG TPA: NAD-dependent epimerase/dehydratase family protein [Longimicrobium sp.]|nr:NAD-dependent epimerase/dehydratase family protein [Longimicrobium sp.]